MIRPTVVMVHGLGGSPTSLGDVPDALRVRGWTVHTPLLAGHGTSVDDLELTSSEDWVEAVHRVVGASGQAVVVGQSLGGVLGVLAAARHPTVIGLVLINAPVASADPDVIEHLEWMLQRGVRRQPCGPPDLRDPEATDPSYGELPIGALLELVRVGDCAWQIAPTVHCPAMVITSDLDQTVDPFLGDDLAERLAGPVTRLRLPNSGHVACRDLDRHQLTAEISDWLDRLSAAST